jgi:hypothetical protein
LNHKKTSTREGAAFLFQWQAANQNGQRSAQIWISNKASWLRWGAID